MSSAPSLLPLWILLGGLTAGIALSLFTQAMLGRALGWAALAVRYRQVGPWPSGVRWYDGCTLQRRRGTLTRMVDIGCTADTVCFRPRFWIPRLPGLTVPVTALQPIERVRSLLGEGLCVQLDGEEALLSGPPALCQDVLFRVS